MDFQLRPATLHDLEEILAIYNHEILTGTANWNDQVKSLETYRHWFEQLQQDHYPMWIAYDPIQQRVAGYAYYAAFRSISGYKHTIEHSVFISPEYKRRGLGKILMEQMIELAKAQAFHIMIGAIDSENKASIVLHERLGFVQTGYLPQVGQKFGHWRDLVFMQLQLDEA
ncbi:MULTISPECIES: GNAT family N-acetyltransferase [unclassified Acinetobacter]|uniref:GNAT family N-acetyltransferase n=1 Tax=unclassified Acinetobacter TaxID=196816 RepID=UPI00190A2142|nr:MULTISPECIES: GNAT family N-acetyltransferase [unclassified Acinetobacter]MBK0063539.1 N-acetyltransferase family protein [Acinetobacter sp. S55]MBK0065390.1 N-acetyltransferase family protein [Acinetobacter sp. S54]